jgi:MFS family permease
MYDNHQEGPHLPTIEAPSARPGHPRKWTILALVLAAECMDLLDGTIVNVAAPTIHARLHASTASLQWIIGGYALAFAAGLIGGGRLGDIYGRRRLFIVGALGFVGASVACAFSVSPAMLIVCRGSGSSARCSPTTSCRARSHCSVRSSGSRPCSVRSSAARSSP